MQAEKSARHLAAIEYAEAGIPVFPCIPGSKKPATPNGFKDATTDVRRIDAWWSGADYNVAFSPHMAGLGIIDVDGDEGRANWEALVEERGAPATYTVQTPRGGLHLYYKGEVPASQSKLAEHIDTRGVGSYALIPPSIFEGKPYVLIDDRDPVALPDWVVPAIRVRAKVEAPKGVELDTPSSIQRAVALLRGYVKRGHVAIEGQMGDNRTFAVAAELKDLGVSPEKTLELLLEHWNPHCIPPWDEEELWVKVENANRNPQIEAGAYAVPSAGDLWSGEVLGKLAPEEDDPPGDREFRFKGYTLEELAARPEPVWLLPEFMAEQGLGLIYGPPGGYKTFMALDRAAQVARTGRPVVWIAGEGAPDVVPRLRAWRALHGYEGPLPIRVFEDMPMAASVEELHLFVQESIAQGIRADLIVIDTAATMMVGLNENDAKDAGLFVKAMKNLRDAFGAAVLAIHHTGKDEGRGTRGSNAIPAGVDSAFEVRADTAIGAVAVTVARQRSVKRRDRPWTYEAKEIAGSLAFQEIDLGEYHKLTVPDDAVSPAKVARALGSEGLNAKFPSTVSTHALATALHHAAEDEAPEDTQAAVGRLVKLLKLAGTKGKLADIYAMTDGRELLWSVR